MNNFLKNFISKASRLNAVKPPGGATKKLEEEGDALAFAQSS